MEHNQHFKELLQLLNAHSVEFLVVGGYAVMKYSEPRFTESSGRANDIDHLKQLRKKLEQ